MRGLLLAALLAVAVPAAVPAAAAEPEFSPAKEELALAEQAFQGGLYEFVAARMKRLLNQKRGEFPGRDRAVLLLAESDYLSGRRKAGWKRLESFPGEFPKSPHLEECEFWIGRAESEHRDRHFTGARKLRKLLQKLKDRAGSDPELLARTRYYLCLALVERGEVRDLDGEIKARPDGKGGEKKVRVPGALALLNEHIKNTKKVLLAEAHVLRGRALYLRGRPKRCFEKLGDEFLKVKAFESNPLRGEALFWQAEARYGQSEWTEAAKLFAAAAGAAERFGKNPARDSLLAVRAHYSRGWALYKRAEDLRRAGLTGRKGTLEAALESFEAVIARGGKTLAAAARLRAGAALQLLGRHDQALKRLDPLRANRRHGAEALYFSARAVAGRGDYQGAGKLFDQAAERSRKRSVLRARIDFALGENLFQRAALATKAGKKSKRKGDPKAAARFFAEEKKHLKSSAGFFAKVRHSSAPATERYEAQLWIARIRARQGRLPEAVRITGDLQLTLPAREALRQDRITYYRGKFLLEMAEEGRKVVRLRIEGRKQREDTRSAAIKHFGQARQAGPRGEFAVPATLGAAKARLMLNETPEAHNLYAAVLKHPAATPAQIHEAHLGIAKTLRASRRYRKAAKYVQEKLLDAKPPPAAELRARAMKFSADCLAAADDSQAASKAYARLASATADRTAAARARIARAEQLAKLGRHAQAASELVGLLKSCPREVRARVEFLAAEAHRRAKQYAPALKLYTAAAARPGKHQAEAQVSAAELELESGNAARAAAQARKALDLEPVKAGSLLAARAALVRARALMATDAAGAARQFRQAADAARGQRSRPEGRDLERKARRGLGEALVKLKRHEDAAASYLKAAYLLDSKKPDPELLELAATALEAAGKQKAATQVRRLAKNPVRRL